MREKFNEDVGVVLKMSGKREIQVKSFFYVPGQLWSTCAEVFGIFFMDQTLRESCLQTTLMLAATRNRERPGKAFPLILGNDTAVATRELIRVSINPTRRDRIVS